MTKDISANKTKLESSFGYHDGEVETVISVDDVNRRAQELAEKIIFSEFFKFKKFLTFLMKSTTFSLEKAFDNDNIGTS